MFQYPSIAFVSCTLCIPLYPPLHPPPYHVALVHVGRHQRHPLNATAPQYPATTTTGFGVARIPPDETRFQRAINVRVYTYILTILSLQHAAPVRQEAEGRNGGVQTPRMLVWYAQ